MMFVLSFAKKNICLGLVQSYVFQITHSSKLNVIQLYFLQDNGQYLRLGLVKGHDPLTLSQFRSVIL
jgi:hypothetical protein